MGSGTVTARETRQDRARPRDTGPDRMAGGRHGAAMPPGTQDAERLDSRFTERMPARRRGRSWILTMTKRKSMPVFIPVLSR